MLIVSAVLINECQYGQGVLCRFESRPKVKIEAVEEKFGFLICTCVVHWRRVFCLCVRLMLGKIKPLPSPVRRYSHLHKEAPQRASNVMDDAMCPE